MASTKYQLPDLNFAYDALEPHISAKIMELHHKGHHQAYVTNLNKLVIAYDKATLPDRAGILKDLNFHGGGHINHTLFWENLSPASSPDASLDAAPSLVEALTKTYDSPGHFMNRFSAALLGIQGSGWGWLVKDEATGALSIETTKDQDPVTTGVPILGVDMWEHAYYLQYLNGKQAYVDQIWKVINWKTAEERFRGGRADVFKTLKALL